MKAPFPEYIWITDHDFEYHEEQVVWMKKDNQQQYIRADLKPVCRWDKTIYPGLYKTTCGKGVFGNSLGPYCSSCGGKIEEEK